MSAIARNLLSFTFGCFTLGINFVFDSFTHLVILWYLIFYSCHPLLHFHICHFMLVVCIVLVSIYPAPLLYCFFLCVCRIIFFFLHLLVIPGVFIGFICMLILIAISKCSLLFSLNPCSFISASIFLL